MSEAWFAFIGGVIATLVGGFVASIIQRHNEEHRRKSEARLDVYFRLLELNQQYFWIASSEVRGAEAPPEVVQQCRELSWKLADKLRACDSVEHLGEILNIVFSNSIESANERANKLTAVIDKYGALVNPRYAKAIKVISEENILLFGSGRTPRNIAPAHWSFGKTDGK